MDHFSEESIFLAENWQTVQDIISAIDAFEVQLWDLLLSLKDSLINTEWWDEGWQFLQFGSSKVAIVRNQWYVGDENVVSIGVRGFTLGAILGGDNPPEQYVWVRSGYADLSDALVNAIVNRGDLKGDATHTSRDRIVTAPLQKCHPGMIENYPDLVSTQLLDFFGHYASVLLELDDLIQREVG